MIMKTAQDIAVTAVPVTDEVVDHHLKPALKELAPKLEEAAHSVTTDVIKPTARDVADTVEDIASDLQRTIPRAAEELGDMFMEQVPLPFCTALHAPSLFVLGVSQSCKGSDRLSGPNPPSGRGSIGMDSVVNERSVCISRPGIKFCS